MKDTTLFQSLDYIGADTEITLYIGDTKLCNSLMIYDFPHRHDSNKYYAHKVEGFEATGLNKMNIYLSNK